MSTIKSSTEHLTLNADGAGKEIKFQANGVEVASISSTGNLTSTGIDDNATSTAITIDSSEKVGIGTSSPANKLEVTGAIVAQGAVTAYTNTGLYLQNKGSSVVDVGSWRSGASVAELSFSTDSGSDAAPVERMRIDSSGNVGIGTTAPGEKLNVAGNIRVGDGDATYQIYGGFGAKTTGGTTNWNDSTNARSGNGNTLLLGTATNGPGGGNYYHSFTFAYGGGGNMTQWAIGYNSNSRYQRYRYSSTWSSWSAF